jgi:hypothetical protein
MSKIDCSLLLTFMQGSVGIPDIVIKRGMITNGQMLVLTHGPHRATQGLDWLTGILEEA